MKKYVFLLSLLTLTFASCEGPMGPPGDGVTRSIINFTVHEGDWKLVGRVNELNSFYMYEFPAPEVTAFVCEKGNVFGYRWFDIDEQTPLGQVVHIGELINGNEYLFTETYSFSFRPGYITFYVDYSDFVTDIPPGTCDFRIVLNY
jgi:hypothetical protein